MSVALILVFGEAIAITFVTSCLEAELQTLSSDMARSWWFNEHVWQRLCDIVALLPYSQELCGCICITPASGENPGKR